MGFLLVFLPKAYLKKRENAMCNLLFFPAGAVVSGKKRGSPFICQNDLISLCSDDKIVLKAADYTSLPRGERCLGGRLFNINREPK